MNKAYIAIIIAIILVIAGYFAYSATSTIDNGIKSSLTKTQVEQKIQQKEKGFEQIGFLDQEIVPLVQEITAGTTVKWTNYGNKPQIVSGLGFKSPVLRPGDSFEYTFKTPGEYNYVSDLRDFEILQGTINVK